MQPGQLAAAGIEEVFQGGQIRANIRAAKDQREAAYLTYQQTILGALENVEAALARYQSDQQRLLPLRSNLAAARNSLLIARQQYGVGLVNFLNVLQAENATYPWYPASTSKLMTTYVTLQAVKSGRITMDTLLTVSPNAVAQTPSKMGFRAGVTVTVDNALKMLLVHSANDIAVVLAEGVSGSI